MAHANLVERVVMKKLIVTGLRTCERKDLVYAEISKFIAEIGGVDEIVSGGSSGVDQYTKQYAQEHGIKFKEFVPDFQSHINAATFIRDAEMAEYATHLLVLSNGISKESKNLIAEAKENNLQVKSVGGFEGRSEADHYHSGAFPTPY
ncbi:MAG TPA: DUF2493 domain-containing protein [Methanospirillum sp.]|uniref:DUF2493 domain-containing protein n=1 Tax=Methanospirillum sp. TaxID=45200 RepID=UPI002BFF7173|nr:DUF2493 domain-containing protein [Methanospirillum sp.]HOJ95344.1 DUF2493 domain-containing protein [Methanospirillum sp.]HPP76738.1 DUF2493 domain-containing protein [Methanospirillum sp.]